MQTSSLHSIFGLLLAAARSSLVSLLDSTSIPSALSMFSLETWSPGALWAWLSNTFESDVTINMPPVCRPSPFMFPLIPLALL